MDFGKYTGAGNDFVITEAHWPDDQGTPVARYVCDRATGVGVDGLALVWRIESHRVSQSIYFADPDGNEIELYVDDDPRIWKEDPSAVAHVEPFEL